MMEEKLQKYIEGRAKHDEVESVIRNLLSDDKTEESDKLLFSYWQECMKKKTIRPSKRDFINKVHQTLGTNGSFNRKIKIYKTISYVAATVLLFIILGSVYYFQTQNSSDNIITQTIKTPHGARTSFDLPDGSKIWLNSGSTVIFPSLFIDKRIIHLTGEAFLDVKKRRKPFIVSTKYGDVEALGTTFNVNAYDDEIFQTTLVTGRVKVINKKEVYLDPGYQYYKDIRGDARILKVDTYIFTSWKDGELIFKNEPFKSVVKKLERWYNVKIYLKDKSLEKLKYTGTIRMESFSEVLEVLEITSPIKYSFNQETRVITITQPK